jgi:hypothetical protein
MRRSGWIEDRHERTGRRWRARYRGPDGRIRSRSFDRKVDADRWLVARLGSIDRGDWIAPETGDVPRCPRLRLPGLPGSTSSPKRGPATSRCCGHGCFPPSGTYR